MDPKILQLVVMALVAFSLMFKSTGYFKEVGSIRLKTMLVVIDHDMDGY